MLIRDLSTALRAKKSGWVAIDSANKVVASAQSFEAICKKVENKKDEVILVPAAESYFGFVTAAHD